MPAVAACCTAHAHTLQGDVLSGTLAAFTAWTVNSKDGGAAAAEQSGVPALLLAAYGATRTVRHASEVSLPDTDSTCTCLARAANSPCTVASKRCILVMGMRAYPAH